MGKSLSMMNRHERYNRSSIEMPLAIHYPTHSTFFDIFMFVLHLVGNFGAQEFVVFT